MSLYPLGLRRLVEPVDQVESQRRAVIGLVDATPIGNTIIRVGRGDGHSWEQTEHVVLTPEERDVLIDSLVALRAQS